MSDLLSAWRVGLGERGPVLWSCRVRVCCQAVAHWLSDDGNLERSTAERQEQEQRGVADGDRVTAEAANDDAVWRL